ncbi:MAG: hypothetical protein ACWGOX_01070 [Desulforhopalus sp.]
MSIQPPIHLSYLSGNGSRQIEQKRCVCHQRTMGRSAPDTSATIEPASYQQHGEIETVLFEKW